METIRHLIRPDDIVLELGSGLGIVSAFIAQRLSGSRNLHTFEANPELLGPIKSVFEANDVKPNLHNIAVGQEDGCREFFFNVNDLSSSVHRREGAATSDLVAMASMSRLLREIRPTFVVFDVEGAEAEIFKAEIPPEVRVLCGETDLTDAEWRLVAPLLPAPNRTGATSQVSSNLPRLSSRRNSVGVLPVHRLNARTKVLGSR
jgi:FkbM family methyltransferase